MGTAPDNLSVIIDLHRRGLFKMPASIADLGCQQMYIEDQLAEAASRRFLEHFGKSAPYGEQALLKNRSFTGHLFEAAGFYYRSFDVVDAPFCERLDLNVDTIRRRFRNRFDLVFNFGTTEHVMNQYNAMRILHDFCKPGGLIYGMFLVNGYQWHGIIRYTQRFIDMMCRSNEYEVLYDCNQDQTYSKWRSSVGPDEPEESYFRDVCRWMVLRKTSERPFREIVDVE